MAVTVADEGEYRCVATNEHVPRSVTSQTALLEVKGKTPINCHEHFSV